MSKYTEAFDSLKSDDNTKSERVERILSAQSETAEIKTADASKPRRKRVSLSKRGIALITAAAVVAVTVGISVPTGIHIRNNAGLLGAMARLKNTFVDMDGVTAFGVWNAPEGDSAKARISNVSYVRAPKNSDGKQNVSPADSGDVISGEWSDDERYEWESDYDWDPTKANVLVSIDADGKISEVVYERINGRGQIRQDTLGNAVTVYVSDSFTYVMYVDDDEWKFWKDINFAQEMYGTSGFHCHHERMQTVVIHNATGKVFALKDLIPQVNELSGATNHTMQAIAFKNDFLCVRPMYGRYIPLWFVMSYDETAEKIRYELALLADSDKAKSYYWDWHVRGMRRDIYGQNYLFECTESKSDSRIEKGTVDLPPYERFGNSVTFSVSNGFMKGADGRMYAFDDGKLKVFGENFELRPVEAGTKTAFEGATRILTDGSNIQGHEGIVYKLQNGFLYSMFGEVWKVDDDGTMHALEQLSGTFPRYADEGYLLNGELIAFVNTTPANNGTMSANGDLVRIRFDFENGVHRELVTNIIKASELDVRFNNRMVVEQNENPHSAKRGRTKYYLVTVRDGEPVVDFFARGYDGGVTALTKPLTEPIVY